MDLTKYILTQAPLGSFRMAARYRIATSIVADEPLWPRCARADDHHKLKLALFDEIRNLLGASVNPRYVIPTQEDVQAAGMLWPVRARRGSAGCLNDYRASLRFGGPLVSIPLGQYLDDCGLPSIPNIPAAPPEKLTKQELRELDRRLSDILDN